MNFVSKQKLRKITEKYNKHILNWCHIYMSLKTANICLEMLICSVKHFTFFTATWEDQENNLMAGLAKTLHKQDWGIQIQSTKYIVLISSVWLPIFGKVIKIFGQVTHNFWFAIWLLTFLPIQSMILPIPDYRIGG